MSEFIIIVESRADFETSTGIAKRVICEQIDWIEIYYSDSVQWRGLDSGSEFSCWRDLKKIREDAVKRGIRLPRFLGHSQKLKADGAAALKVLQLVSQLQRERDIGAVVLIRDLDHQTERRDGLASVRRVYEERSAAPAIIIGTANGKREAWVLNGYIPVNEHEKSILTTLQEQLTFDPTTQAHRLRETTFDEPDRDRNAKVVLQKLTENDQERERHCWQDTPLDLLRERGKETGLADYICEVEERLAPLLQ